MVDSSLRIVNDFVLTFLDQIYSCTPPFYVVTEIDSVNIRDQF